MTVSTSTAGYNYNAAGTAITGSYNDTILPYLGPYQLKFGEQLNFSCDKTTKMAEYILLQKIIHIIAIIIKRCFN